MEILVIIIGFLAILSLWRKLHQSYKERKFKYRVYGLRDELRRLVIEGKLSADNWIFEYYDKTFSIAICQSYYLTLFRLLMLKRIHFGDAELNEMKNKVDVETSKNPELVKIREKYLRATEKYIVGQHFVSFLTLILPFITAILGTKLITAAGRKFITNILVFPETSDSTIKYA